MVFRVDLLFPFALVELQHSLLSVARSTSLNNMQAAVAPVINTFLHGARHALGTAMLGGSAAHVTLVLGNEGGDMDSVVSAIYESVFLAMASDTETDRARATGSDAPISGMAPGAACPPPPHVFCPVLNFAAEDLALRGDVAEALEAHGVHLAWLAFAEPDAFSASLFTTPPAASARGGAVVPFPLPPPEADATTGAPAAAVLGAGDATPPPLVCGSRSPRRAQADLDAPSPLSSGGDAHLSLRSPSLRDCGVFLVDHNRLCERQAFLAGRVVGVVDHHADERLYLPLALAAADEHSHQHHEHSHHDHDRQHQHHDGHQHGHHHHGHHQHLHNNEEAVRGGWGRTGALRIVRPVGSCASLVALQFEAAGLAVPAPTLLLAPILLDTHGLDPAMKKVTPDDIRACDFLLRCAQLPERASAEGAAFLAETYRALYRRRTDVSTLTVPQALRRDYKKFDLAFPFASAPSNGAGVASAAVGISAHVESYSTVAGRVGREAFVDGIAEFNTSRACAASLVSFVSTGADGAMLRELLMVVPAAAIPNPSAGGEAAAVASASAGARLSAAVYAALKGFVAAHAGGGTPGLAIAEEWRREATPCGPVVAIRCSQADSTVSRKQLTPLLQSYFAAFTGGPVASV